MGYISSRVEKHCRERRQCFFQAFSPFTHNVFKSFFVKGGYLDFSHLTELKNIYLTEICMTKRHKSSITKNYKIKQKIFFDAVPLKGYVAS